MGGRIVAALSHLVDAGIIVVDDFRASREAMLQMFAARGVPARGAWGIPSLLDEWAIRPAARVLISSDTAYRETLLQVSLNLEPKPPVVVFGMVEEREAEIIRCAEAGVAGLHLRSEPFDHLLDVVRGMPGRQALCSSKVSAILLHRVYTAANHNGQSHSFADSLTARESQILDLLELGLTNQQIANRLHLTVATVKNHVRSVLTKLGVKSRGQAATLARVSRDGAAHATSAISDGAQLAASRDIFAPGGPRSAR